jgi:ribulose-5-phosphate 4-epimerase/fuculose-1-phosphate aldolase
MGKLNKFLFEYVNKISSLNSQKNKTINLSVTKFIRKEIEQSLNAIAFRDFVVRDLFEISMRQSASHFVALNKYSWNQFQEIIPLDLLSISSDWSLESGKGFTNISFHQNIYKHTTANAIIICHPLELYELILTNIDFRQTPHLPKANIFDQFTILSDNLFEIQDEIPRLLFSYEKGLISWGTNLFEAINQIDLLIFSAKLALIQN